MIRFISLLVILSITVSCSTLKEDRQLKEIYLHEFKITYFKTLLRKAFNNDKGYLEAVKIDRSNYGEIILVAGELRLIDSLTTIDNQFMVTDSIDGIGRKAEGTEGKVVFNYALDKYNSKWLDSISKIHFKKYWKSEINFRKSLRK